MQEVNNEFESLCGFPQVAGAIDGTQIPIIKPKNSPSEYYNRKGFYSVLMQKVVDSHGQFISLTIAWPGKIHDAQVFINPAFYRAQINGQLLPKWKRNVGSVEVQLLTLDDHTNLQLPWMNKVYPEIGRLSLYQRYFNYRQSRVRMIVENSYRRLEGRWRCLLKKMDYYKMEHVVDVIASCVVLRNIYETMR